MHKLLVSVLLCLTIGCSAKQHELKHTLTPREIFIQETKVTGLVVTQRGLGTGFFILAPSGATLVVTNAHVCLTATTTTMLFVDAFGQKWKVRRLRVNRTHDICLLKPTPTKSTGWQVANVVESIGKPPEY